MRRRHDGRYMSETVGHGQSLQRYQRSSLIGLLVLFLGLSLASARHKSITVDEAKHYEYGLQILNLNSDRLNSGGTIVDDSKMPFTALNALPAKLTPYLPDGWLKRFSATIQAGRPITIVFSTFVAFVLFLWSKRLYGPTAALLSLFLYALEPSIIAHSHFVTTDIYAMGMMLFSVWALWYFNQRPSWGRLALVALTLGVSQIAKYTSVFLVPLLVVMQLVHDSNQIIKWLREHDWGALFGYLRWWAVAGALTAVLTLLVINAGYLFNRTMTPFGDYGFKSGILRAFQTRLPFMNAIPVPAPYPYLEGLDLVMYRDQIGFGYGKIFLLGRLSPQGFPGYYWVDMALKTPIPILIFVVLGLIALARRRPSWDRLLKNESFLIIPSIWFLIYMNYLLHAQLGIRLLLVIYPFLLILAGNVVRDMRLQISWPIAATGLLAVWLVVSVLRFYPHFLPYSNELIWDKRTAYTYLANGEFDWGQSQLYLDEWLAGHPGAVLDPPEPVGGLVVATPKRIVGTPRYQDPNEFAWLRDNFEPVDVIAYTFPVFDITPDDLKRLSSKASSP